MFCHYFPSPCTHLSLPAFHKSSNIIYVFITEAQAAHWHKQRDKAILNSICKDFQLCFVYFSPPSSLFSLTFRYFATSKPHIFSINALIHRNEDVEHHRQEFSLTLNLLPFISHWIPSRCSISDHQTSYLYFPQRHTQHIDTRRHTKRLNSIHKSTSVSPPTHTTLPQSPTL